MRLRGQMNLDEFKSDVNYRETYLRLLKYAKPYWYLIAIIIILALISSFIGVLPAQVMGVAVDNIFQFSRNNVELLEGTTIGGGFERVLPITPYIDRVTDFIQTRWLSEYSPALVVSLSLALVFLVLFILSQIVSLIQGFITVYIGQSLIFDMRNQVYNHLQKLSFNYFADKKTGDLMARTVNDVDSLAQIVVEPVVELVTNLSTLIFVLYFCLIWSWQLTLLSLVAIPILIIVTKLFGRILRKHFRLLRERIGKLNGFLQDNISGIRVIKGFCREDYEYDRFQEKNFATYESRIKLGYLFRIFRPIIEFLNQVGTIVVLLFGSMQVYNGIISPGIFVTFFRYLPMLYNPVTGLARFYHQIQQALASSERVFEVLDSKPDIQDKRNAIELNIINGEVVFQNVNFSYNKHDTILQDINMHIKPGQMIAFVGPSGAGKTTLTNLIPRFYDPVEGNIFIDNYNLKDIKIESFRREIGIVQQEPFLFNDTIKNNIAYGKLNASIKEIIEAAKAANCHQFITSFPEGYNTIIGERGVKLSGGQKQRLSIARAILADPKILIFDEATSSVDTETELLIQKAIINLVKNRTTFVIAHRLSTIQDADLIVVLEDGKIVETGNHLELIKRNGLYTKLHEMQYRSGDKEASVKVEKEEINDNKLNDLGNMVDNEFELF